MSAAAFILSKAAQIKSDDLLFTPQEVRRMLTQIADELEPAELVDQQTQRIPLVGNYVAEYLGRLLFRGEQVETDYARCVQVSHLLGDTANRLDTKGDHARADLVRRYAFAVSLAGNAL